MFNKKNIKFVYKKNYFYISINVFNEIIYLKKIIKKNYKITIILHINNINHNQVF